MSNHSEASGPFIAYFLTKLGCNIDLHDDSPLLAMGDIERYNHENTRGLYVFYMKDNTESETRYPIYVGVTGRSFYVRFKEHAAHGQILKVWDDNYPQNVHGYQLYAWTLNTNHVIAKYLESVLLEAWDFPLNKSENGVERDGLDTSDQHLPEEDKADFNISWENYFQDIQAINNEYVN